MAPDHVKQLVYEGWRQVSRRYCIVARLPPGMTGKQALAKHDPDLADHLTQSEAEDQYLRVYAGADGLTQTLSMADFIKFRKLGGEAA